MKSEHVSGVELAHGPLHTRLPRDTELGVENVPKREVSQHPPTLIDGFTGSFVFKIIEDPANLWILKDLFDLLFEIIDARFEVCDDQRQRGLQLCSPLKREILSFAFQDFVVSMQPLDDALQHQRRSLFAYKSECHSGYHDVEPFAWGA